MAGDLTAVAPAHDDRSGAYPICPACGWDEHDDWHHCLDDKGGLPSGKLECGCGAVFSIKSYSPGWWTSHLVSLPPVLGEEDDAAA